MMNQLFVVRALLAVPLRMPPLLNLQPQHASVRESFGPSARAKGKGTLSVIKAIWLVSVVLN